MKRVLLIALVFACGKDKGSSSDSDDNKKGGCQIQGSKVADLVTGKAPQVLAPFSTLKLGMSATDAKAACPNLFEGDKAQKTGTFSTGAIVGQFDKDPVYARLNFAKDKLVQFDWSLPDGADAAFTAAWGAPKKAEGSKPANAWLDEASGLRAILAPDYKGMQLSISAFVPLKAFVEHDTKTIAWKPQDVLGKTPAELEKAFPQYVGKDDTSEAVKAKTKEMMADMEKDMKAMGMDPNKNKNDLEVRLPATPLANGTETQVILHLNDEGGVRSYGLWFRTENLGNYGFPSEPKDVVKLYDETWGAPKTIKETLGERRTWFDATKKVRASTRVQNDRPNQVDIDFVRYLPLAEFFGPAGTVWGFEKAERPLIGASVEELTAIYGKALKVKDGEGTATITLPPTDYDGDTSVTTILLFLDKGKVREWRTSLPYEDYEPARAEYEAALTAKLGAPKPQKDHFIYGKAPRIDAEYSKYTNNLNLIVSAK